MVRTAGAVVGDLRDEMVIAFGDLDLNELSAGVLGHIGKRFRTDEEDRGLHDIGEPALGHADGDPNAGSPREVIERTRQALGREATRPQARGEPHAARAVPVVASRANCGSTSASRCATSSRRRSACSSTVRANRRRSASPAVTRRRADASNSSTRAATSSRRRMLPSAIRAAAAAARSSTGSANAAGSWTNAATGSPPSKIRVAVRCRSPVTGSSTGRPASSTYPSPEL